MTFVLHGTFRRWIVTWRGEARAAEQRVELREPSVARAFLARIAAQPGEMDRLRRIAGERLVIAGGGPDDERVLDQLARWIAVGDLLLWEVCSEPLGARDGVEGEPREAPAAAKTAATELTWITIQLLGEDDEPIPNIRYRIDLPDGGTRDGRLDDKGLARVRGIEPGHCVVTFPELDEAAWAPLRTTGEP